jgi:hypothetical protein
MKAKNINGRKLMADVPPINDINEFIAAHERLNELCTELFTHEMAFDLEKFNEFLDLGGAIKTYWEQLHPKHTEKKPDKIECPTCNNLQEHSYPMSGKLYCIACGELLDQINDEP